jgi:TonB family protein
MRGDDGTTVSIDSTTVSRMGDATFLVRTATAFPERMELENGQRFTREIDVEELNCGADSVRGYVSQLYADTSLVLLVPLASTWEVVAENRHPVFAASCEYLLGAFATLRKSYPSEAVDQAPELANRRQVASALSREYPPRMLDANQRGEVVLRFRITETGAVDNASISLISFTDPAFAESAIRVVSEMRFRPARYHGEGVPVWVMIPLRFAIRSELDFPRPGTSSPPRMSPNPGLPPEIPPSRRP